jgi:hypothetical protein
MVERALHQSCRLQPIPDAFRERTKDKMKTKFGKFSTTLLLGTVLFTASAFAADKGDKETVEIRNPVMLNGSQLAAGKYTVTWEGNGPSVELKFMKGKGVAATVPAHFVNLSTATYPGLIVTKHDNDSLVLTEIMPSGKKYALAIGNDSVQTAADTSTK